MPDGQFNDNDLIAQLLTRVGVLERERDEARSDKNEWSRYHQQALFKEAQAVEALAAAEAREGALQQRVEELEGAAQFDKAIFAGECRLRQTAVTRALEAEARERALEADCASLRETKDTFFRNAEAWETKCNAAWMERDHAREAYTQWAELYGEAEARERALRDALRDLVSECEDYARINHLHNADGSPATTGAMKHARAVLSEGA